MLADEGTVDALHEALAVVATRVRGGSTLAFLVLMSMLIVGPKLAEAVRLPAMVGLVLGGMAVGKHGLQLLDADAIALPALGNFGLLYLMFCAGLELDLKLFSRMKRVAISFALLSFAIPFTLGVMSARLLGYAWAGAVLMGSNWSSHTLVTYPIVRHMGLAKNRGVGTVVGATAATDTSALLVLAGVASVVKGTGRIGAQMGAIAVGLVVLAFWTLFALPKIARWFFAQVGPNASYRFIFGTAAFLSGAVVAEAGSIDGIVGAFFVGLGLNRSIPERSPLMDRVQFFGSALLIPIFLVSVGALLDPKVMLDPKTLLVATVFTVAAVGGKALAAVVAGRAFRLSWAETGVMAGLSGSQAAATLATTLVGARLGIFDALTVNAVLIVILVSLAVTPAMVTFFGKQVRMPATAETPLASAVLVPVFGESTKPLLDVAARIAEEDGGIVVAVTFVDDTATEGELASGQELRDQAEEWLAKGGYEALSVLRIASSVSAGALHVMRSESASLLLAEMRGDLEPSREGLRMEERSTASIVLVHGPLEPFDRFVLVAHRENLVRPGRLDLELGAEFVRRLARGRPVACAGPSMRVAAPVFPPKLHIEPIDTSDPLGWVDRESVATDVIVFAGADVAREALARLPSLAERKFVVAIAPRWAPTAKRLDAVVVGRTATEGGRGDASGLIPHPAS